MDLRLLGLGVFVLIVVSGGAVIPFLGFSAIVCLAVFLAYAVSDLWRSADGRREQRKHPRP
jgi:hypothetical protein